MGGLGRTSGSRRPGARHLVGIAVCLVVLGGAAPAWAGVAVTAAPGFPSSARVGQTGVPVTLTLSNVSTPPESGGNVVVSSITLVPSCGSLSFGDCPAANVDPGVFNVSPTGVGEAGTACAGMTFSLGDIDSSQGKLAFSPTGGSVILTPPGTANAICRIDFVVDVLRLPAKDADPGAGLQTAELAAAVGQATINGAISTTFNSTETSISKGTPGITALVSTFAGTVGQPISDTATLTAASGSAAPTGSVTFRLYGPGDSTCSGAPVGTFTAALSGASATSATYSPTAVGTYQYTATYNGDANNNSVATACGDAFETVTVRAQPHIATHVASATASIGDAISDTATMAPGQGGPAPTGSVTFAVYGPGDTTCANPLERVTAQLSGATANSAPPTFTASANGTYQFVATYNGDASNNAVSGACNDPNETVTVSSGTDEPPTAAYTPSTYTPAAGQTVSFNGAASSDPDGSIVTYRWVWNDGTPDGSGVAPTHVFTAEGVHSVALYVTDSSGQTVAVGHGITVGDELPIAAYTPSTYTPAVGQTVSFNGTASNDPDGSITTYRWVWNDGTPDGSGPTPTHVFTTAGTRSVALYVTDSAGRTAAVGHGITVSGDELPTAAYTPSTYTPAAGQTVSFNGTASNDPDGSIVTYRWVWNDGTPDGSGPTPTHVFTVEGVHSVALYVTDSNGQTGAVGHGITVGDELPTAAYTPSTYTPTVGQTVTFNGTASNDPDGSITTYRWVWNDGTPDGSGPTPTHVFTTAGTRSVALYVTDSAGKTAAVGHGITVNGGA
jgi:PKD repeat protein